MLSGLRWWGVRGRVTFLAIGHAGPGLCVTVLGGSRQRAGRRRAGMWRERELPVLRERALARAGVDVAVLRRITVVLGRAGGGKWHVPGSGAGWRSHCRYAAHLTGRPLVLLDVVEQVCRHCAPLVGVDPGEEALWRAAVEVVAADVRVRALEGQEAGPRSWDGYARVLWEAARNRDVEVAGLPEPWTSDRVFGAGVRQMRQAWAGVLARSEAALAEWRAAAPSACEATSVSGACDAVAADGQVQRQGLGLAAAVVEHSRWAEPFDAWGGLCGGLGAVPGIRARRRRVRLRWACWRRVGAGRGCVM